MSNTPEVIEPFHVIKVDHNLYDVFTGDGWLNWSRFEKRGPHLLLVKGLPVSKEVYSELKKL